MHNVDDAKADPYYWPRNCSLAPKPTSFSYTISLAGGCITVTGTDYSSSDCNTQQQFVCEVPRDSCSYETKTNTSVSVSVPYTLVRGSNVTWCKAACDAQGIDCWAVTHSPSLEENTDPMNWMQYDAQPLASPCSLNQSGRVYTVVTLSRTAEQARAHCHAMGHELAGPAVVSDRNVLQSIINYLYSQDTYFVNQTYPLWVSFTGGPYVTSVWGNGSVVTASVTVLGSNTFQCGLLDLDSGTHYLDDCSRPHAFICMTHIILQENDLVAPTTTTTTTTTPEPGTTPLHTKDTTTTSSKPSFLTTEVASMPATSVADTTYSHTVGRTTATPTISTTQKTPVMETTSTTTSKKVTTEIRAVQITTATTNDTSATNASNQSPTGTSASPVQLSQETTSTQTAGYTTATSTTLQKTTFNQSAGHIATTPTAATSLTTQKTQETISTPTSTAVTTETTTGLIASATTAVASASFVSQSSLGDTSSEATQTVTSDLLPETEVNVTSINTTIAKPWMCSCRCSSRSVLIPDAEAISQSLAVQRNATCKSRRRYVSVDDNRPSCRSIGAVAIVFMCFVAAVIVSSDCLARSK
ncbi:hypothetical protein C0Q70_08990 [Pomacea canaliculata]|uniref:C-type lectin domain-containing protein n=1 Tax=Pomacea canaliculata TaxID=400727 RepID=A0A2T7P8J2_POMCA|nr:hypothetical protein C0Q70_08990 [Pomacea canaliculata]